MVSKHRGDYNPGFSDFKQIEYETMLGCEVACFEFFNQGIIENKAFFPQKICFPGNNWLP